MKVCFGIISIGKSYLEEFERLFKPSVEEYCKLYGYDLKVFTEFLDPTHKQPDTISFQKCLVPSFLMDYDLVVVLDADIYIHNHSPPIHLVELGDKIGIVNEVSQSTPENYKQLNEIKIVDYPKQYYEISGFNLDTDKILNTGLILCNPSQHAEYLKSIYEKYVDKSVGHPRKFHYEQSCVGYELQKDNMYTLISNNWNFIYAHSKLTNTLLNSSPFFLHFAGVGGSTRASALSAHISKCRIRWGVKK